TLESTGGRPNGGRGLLFKTPLGVQLKSTPLKASEAKQKLRFQAKGAKTVLPPSRLSSGSLYCDTLGRVTNFHALRHTFIPMVGKAGVSAREHMDLAHHSSYAMTARYSHAQFNHLVAAVQSLPLPTSGPAPSPALAATGTDGRPNCLGPKLGPQPA